MRGKSYCERKGFFFLSFCNSHVNALKCGNSAEKVASYGRLDEVVIHTKQMDIYVCGHKVAKKER